MFGIYEQKTYYKMRNRSSWGWTKFGFFSDKIHLLPKRCTKQRIWESLEAQKVIDTEHFMFGTYEQKTNHVIRILSSWGMDLKFFMKTKSSSSKKIYLKHKRESQIAQKSIDTEYFMFGIYAQKTYHKMRNVSSWGMD